MARLTLSTVATIASLWLLSDEVTAQHFPRQTGVNGTVPTKTSSSSGSVTSFYSEIYGPFIAAVSSTWSQVIIPTTVGTVLVVVNAATNETTSTTIYHTDYLKNGSSTLLSRTDTDGAGTVTQVVTDIVNNNTVTVTYPSNYFEVADSLTWNAVLPTAVNETTCCFPTPTLSATPTHTPFVQVGELDSEDTRGWYYTLVGVNVGDPYTVLDSTEVSSLWSGQTLAIEYDGCPYTFCHLSVTSVAPASGVKAQPGAILATSTTTISIPSETPAEPTPSPSSTSSFTAIPDQDSTTSTPAPAPSPSPPTTQPTSTRVSAPTPNPAPIITIGSTAIPANTASQFIISGQTLVPGSSITIGSGSSTTVIALQTSNSNTVVVIGDSSSTLAPAATTPAVVTVGGSVVTADSSSNFIVGGQTLSPGGSPITVSGTPISLAAEGTQIVEGTKTFVQMTGIGGIIWSVFGGETSTPTVSVTGAPGNGSSASPTYVQASGVIRNTPFRAFGALVALSFMILL
ncbi:hypothetical protein ONS95_007040 [Cadophora gregata]|uniref:uncharacterized protein n=1 Tax=Cadophora gregata TaxID=51156 RepID=UPI0026DBE086|nr:uncharacterized protein ONS95_007040 [Cadophora gregata]KAK0100582.1 hypothetical protein ONS95_007040 [Cadophora gregata]